MAKGGSYSDHIELLQYLLYIFNTVFFIIGAMIFAVALWTRFDEYMVDYVTGLGMYHYWSGIYVLMVSSSIAMVNSFLACCGATIFALGLWIRFNKDMDEYINSLGMYFYWNGATVIMVGATVVMVNSFLACCGAFFKSRKLILTYKVFSVISFLLLLGGSAYVLANGLEDSKLFPWVQVRMRELINQYQWDVASRRIVDIVQEYVGCCGGFSSSDYTNIHMPIPDTCRNQVTGNQYGDSCAEIFSQYIEVRTGWITGLSLSLCFCQFFSMMFALCMWQALREIKGTK